MSRADENIDNAMAEYAAPDAPEDALSVFVKLAEELPIIGTTVKIVAIADGWAFNRQKRDRAAPLIAALVEKIREVEKEQRHYVHREEFKDLFEETLRAYVNQPDPARRESLKLLLLKIIDAPKDHAEHRLFIRLAEELSSNALQVLGSIDVAFTERERREGDRVGTFATRIGIDRDRVDEAFHELIGERLIDARRLKGPDSSERAPPNLMTVGIPEGLETHRMRDYSYMLTKRGRDFVLYSRG